MEDKRLGVGNDKRVRGVDDRRGQPTIWLRECKNLEVSVLKHKDHDVGDMEKHDASGGCVPFVIRGSFRVARSECTSSNKSRGSHGLPAARASQMALCAGGNGHDECTVVVEKDRRVFGTMMR